MPEQKKAVVPRLRFPEFRNAGPWEVKRLGDVLREVKKDSVISADHHEIVNVKLHAKGLEKTGRKPRISRQGRPYYIVRTGDILIGKQNFHNGSIALVTADFDGLVASNAIFHLDVTRNNDKRFVVQYLARPFFYLGVSHLLGGTGQKEIAKRELLNLTVVLPGLAEQQKIADCLSSLDELIELEAKKLDALKAHKKGLMQQLFPREGETTPRLRFPEFRNAGPWEVKRLGEIAEIVKGEQLNRIVLSDKGSYPCINGGVEPSGFTNKYNSEANSITISEGGASCGYVGFMRIRFWLGGHCYRIDAANSINKMFLYFLLKSLEGRLMKLRVGSGLPNIQRKDLENFQLILSTSKEEQQKIADCLSSLDELIELEAKKLEALQAHKKGLMQQLFPQEVG